MTGRVAREADAFARYLAGVPAEPAVVAAYAEAQAILPPAATAADRALPLVAALHPWLARAADAYGRVVAPRSLLRQKLVLLLAILESRPATHDQFAAAAVPALLVPLHLALAGAAFALAFLAGVVLVAPAHLAARLAGR